MDAEYSMICMADFGELTPLEVAVLHTHPKAYLYVRRQVDEGRSVSAVDVARMVYGLWRRSNPMYKHFTARLALETAEEYHGNIAANINNCMAHLVEEIERGAPRHNSFYTTSGIARGLLEMDIREGQTNLPSLSRAVDFQFESMRTRIMQQTPQIVEVASREPAGAAQLLAREEENTNASMNVYYQAFTDDTEARSGPIATVQYDMVTCDDTPNHHWEMTADIAGRDDITSTEVETVLTQRGINNRVMRNPIRRNPKAKLAVVKKELSMGRRALRRAYAFFMDQEREPELKLFISGGNVEVSHDDSDLKFVFKRHPHLQLEKRSVQHSAQWSNIDVSIFTKENVFLCDICVYIADTPVLDQLMALIMMVEAGLEEELIVKGNTKRVSREVDFEALALKSEKLRQKLGQYRINMDTMVTGTAAMNESIIINSTYTATSNTFFTFIDDHSETMRGYVNTWITNSSRTGTNTINTYRATRRSTSINTLHNCAVDNATYVRILRQVDSHYVAPTPESTNEQTQALPV